MVNWEDGQSVAIGNDNLNKLIILQRRYEFINCMMEYLERPEESERSRLNGKLNLLFLEIRAKIKEGDKETYEAMKKLSNNLKADIIFGYFEKLDDWIDSKGISTLGFRTSETLGSGKKEEKDYGVYIED